MNEKTLDYLLSVLDAQKRNCNTDGSAAQLAYYKGMKDMLDAVVSDAFRQEKIVDGTGHKHKVVDLFDYVRGVIT